jgi:hypothetical protein
MKKLSVAFVLIAFTVGGQMAMAADKKPSTAPVQSGSSLTVQGNMKETNASAQSADSGSIPVVDMSVGSSSSSEPPKPLEDQKIKTKSNIKND